GESEFDYIKESKKGPSHWGELKKEWAACKNGRMQSPIDMSSNIVRVVPKLDELKKNYKPQNAIIRNRGHDIQLKWQGDAGSININATEFFLRQMHWHSPSEHTINGQRYDMELHMVHESLKINGKSKIAVVGLLYKIGGPDPLLTKLSNYIETIEDTKAGRGVGVINPSEIKVGCEKYYRYMGSLTIPPCDEGVIWTINKEIKSVSKTQLELLEEVVPDTKYFGLQPFTFGLVDFTLQPFVFDLVDFALQPFVFGLVDFALQQPFALQLFAKNIEPKVVKYKNETEFNYIKGSKHGPLHWGELHKEWGSCNTGTMQSPIDLLNPRVSILPNLGMLNKKYKPQNATIKNRGHDIQVKWEGDAGSININGTEFFLHQAHWHSPSEHTIDGKGYKVELHLVHESPKINGKSEIVVVGILYMIGQPNSILSEWSKYIQAMLNIKTQINIGVVDPSHVQFGGKKFYKYIGSLTVPPCTEGVVWIIDTE
ncbi:hypothetical protein RYX36_018703, partial [Vicia faba]